MMKSYLFTLYLKTKLDLKSAEILITYYAVPLLFFLVMGAVFTSTMPEAKETLIASMAIFAVTMGALIGTPSGILEYMGTDLRKTFKSVGIPLHTIISTTVISGLVNLSVMSVVIFIIAPMAYDATRPQNLGVFILGLIAFTLTTLLIGILIGLYGKTTSQVTMLSQVIFLPSMMLSGIMFPLEMLPTPLEYAGMILPATHGMKILSGNPLEVSSLLIILGMILGATGLIAYKLEKLKMDF